MRKSCRFLVVVALGAVLIGCSGAGETTRKVVKNLNPVNWFGDDEDEKEAPASSWFIRALAPMARMLGYRKTAAAAGACTGFQKQAPAQALGKQRRQGSRPSSPRATCTATANKLKIFWHKSDVPESWKLQVLVLGHNRS